MNKLKFYCAILLAVASFGASAHAAGIGGIGIQFDRMPKGTAATYQDQDGETWTEVFVGKKRGKYTFYRYEGTKTSGRKLSTIQFDNNGRMVSQTGRPANSSNQYKYTYRPFLCKYAFGNCQQNQMFRGAAFIHSGESRTWSVETVKEGRGYRSFFSKPKTGVSGGSFSFNLGKYNLRAIEQWQSEGKKKWVKLIGLK